MSRTSSCSALVFLFAALSSFSTASWCQTMPSQGEPFASSAGELRAASMAVPADHEQSVQVLLKERRYIISADGTVAYRYWTIFRIDAQEAVEGWSEFS